jgi:ribosomal protein S18 acetylase RimI-like enzyme
METARILSYATDSQLELAVQENLFDLFRAMAKYLGGEIEESNGLSRHFSFPTNPMFKGVWNTHLSAETVEAAIDENIAWFEARHAPYFFWWTGPQSSPDDLGQRLQARGLLDMAEQQQTLASGIRQTELGAPGMVADLESVNEAVLIHVPDGFEIKPVRHESALYDFKRTFVETYQIPEWAGQAWVDAALKVGIGQTPWQMYVGYLDGRPVATNMLFNGGGVASVYAVATLPAAQGMGIGSAITLQPLLEAREMGYRHAVLFSSEMGVSVYQRIGFRLTKVRINRYLWRAA